MAKERYGRRFLLGGAMLLCAATCAFAQATGVDPSSVQPTSPPVRVPNAVIQWSEFMTPILQTMGLVISGLLSALIIKGLERLGVSVDIDTQKKINEAVRLATEYGKTVAVMQAQKHGFATGVSVKPPIEHTIEYFKQKWPDLVKKLKWTDDDIQAAVLARPEGIPEVTSPDAHVMKEVIAPTLAVQTKPPTPPIGVTL